MQKRDGAQKVRCDDPSIFGILDKRGQPLCKNDV